MRIWDDCMYIWDEATRVVEYHNLLAGVQDWFMVCCVCLASAHLRLLIGCYTEKATKAWHRQERQQYWHRQNHQQPNRASTKQPTKKKSSKTYTPVI